MIKSWFVSQGKNYNEEKKNNYLIAPKFRADGAERSYWSNITKIEILVAALAPNLLHIQSMHRNEIHDKARPELMHKYWDENNSLFASKFIHTTDKIKIEITMEGTLLNRSL